LPANLPKFLGHYEIVARLGAGGMGEVYRARDQRLQREVALKVLPAEVAVDPDRQRRFAQEARLASALNHPNILTIHDIGIAEGIPFIVSELIDGEALSDQIASGPVAVKKTLELAIQIAEGLSAAHQAGIVHRDMKPANVMVTRAGIAKILDFGLAKPDGPAQPQTGQTEPGMIMGTASFMSPEQARAEGVDFRSDQFSFGLIVYRMLAGSNPFDRPSAVGTLSAIIEAEHKPLAEVNPAVPQPLSWCVDRCLAKDRDRRYASTRDLVLDLKSICERLPQLTAQSAPAAEPHKRSWKAALVIGVASLLAGAAGVYPLRNSTAGVDLTQYRFKPFASDLDYQTSPAWSLDGKHVAYVGEQNGIHQIFVRDLESSMAARVTSAEFDCTSPFWEPGDQHIFFFGKNSLWSIAASGGAPVLVQEGATAAAIARDGQSLATMRIDSSGSLSLWIRGPAGAQPQKYTGEPFTSDRFRTGYLAFSPDNKQLGVWLADWQGRSEFWVLPQPSGEPRQSFSLVQGIYPFTWMPDNRNVLFGGVLPGSLNADIQRADTVSHTIRALTVTTRDAVTPAASPDGKTIAFTVSSNESNLVQVGLDGTVGRTLIGTSRDERDPAWAHKSDQLAFATDRTGAAEIWVKSAQQGWERPLVRGKDFGTAWVISLDEPRFSPDDQRIAYTMFGDRGRAVYVSNVFGGPPLRLAASQSDQRSPEWSPDGSSIAYLQAVERRWALVKAQPGSGSPPVTLYPDCMAVAPKWFGEWITCQTSEGLRLVAADGSTSKVISPAQWIAHGWSADGSGILGVQPSGDGKVLMSLNPASGAERTIGKIPIPAHAAVRGFSLAADGKSFATAVTQPTASVWLLTGFEQDVAAVEPRP
jgi:eukaryotic-like serine/threonine-protein kinase